MCLELSDALLRLVKVSFAREKYRCREKVTTVAVCLCCQLVAWFVVDCSCQQRFLAGIVDKGGAWLFLDPPNWLEAYSFPSLNRKKHNPSGVPN